MKSISLMRPHEDDSVQGKASFSEANEYLLHMSYKVSLKVAKAGELLENLL